MQSFYLVEICFDLNEVFCVAFLFPALPFQIFFTKEISVFSLNVNKLINFHVAF